MGAVASPITSLMIVYSTVSSSADQRKKSKLRVTGLCAGNSPVTGEFPAQMASNTENVSIWWRHQSISLSKMTYDPGALREDFLSGVSVTRVSQNDVIKTHAHSRITWQALYVWQDTQILEPMIFIINIVMKIFLNLTKFYIQLLKRLWDNLRKTLKTNIFIIFVDHLDIVGASPVDAAPTKSSFST